MTSRQAIIAGGGIAGLATAIGLLRLGWDVTVYEQTEYFEPVGAGIGLAPNAVRALGWLGIGDELRRKSQAHGDIAIREPSGRWLVRGNFDEFTRRFGEPTYALDRAELHAMLLDGARGATLRLGHRVTAVVSGPKPVIRIEGAGEAIEDTAELIVGADGIRSAVRGALFPNHPRPAYAGYVTWRGLAPAAALKPASSSMGGTETWGRGQRFGIIPLGSGQVYWYATVSSPKGALTTDGLAGLRARYAGWHDPIPAVLERTRPDALLRHDVYHLAAPLPRYHDTAVVLLGDAAHAMTPDLGQGGGSALEDAVTLVDALERAPDVSSALKSFDRLRRRRTQRLVRIAAAWGWVGQLRSPLAIALRNRVVAALPHRLLLEVGADTLGWRPPARRR